MKIIYLVPKYIYTQKMSRVRFHQINEIAKLSDLIYSGPGWDNYKLNETVTENIKRIYNDDLPDCIIGFDHREMKEFSKCIIPKINMMNEMHSPEGNKKEALDMLNSAGYDFIVCHHKNEMDDPTFDSIRKKLINIPHHVNTSIFRDYGLEKTIDVLLCGSLVLNKYKLRKKFVSVIEKLKGMGINAKIHTHPGGYHPDAYTDKYLIEFAKVINSSKICLTCSSTQKCAFAKYVEIPSCNSLLAGDIPDERQEFFKSFMLEIKDTDTEKEMISSIVEMLQNNQKREELTKIGMEANKQFSMDNYAKKFLTEVQKFLNKKNKKLY